MSPLAQALRRAVGAGVRVSFLVNGDGQAVVYGTRESDNRAIASLPLPEAGWEEAAAGGVHGVVDRLTEPGR